MKLSLLTTSCVVAFAGLAGGCANMHHSEMGASGAANDTTQCKDGATLPGHSRCALHGGIAQPGSTGSSTSSGTSGSATGSGSGSGR
jgi:hypothetical protein